MRLDKDLTGGAEATAPPTMLPTTRPTTRPTARLAPLLGLALLLGADARAKGPAIAPHPDKLVFQPFTYVPPTAKDFRQVLPRSQVPAYLAEDHELPLVTVVLYLRVGSHLEPLGQAGLAGLTGYLMARGGTAAPGRQKTAEALEERLAYLAASLNSAIGETHGQVSLSLLSKDLDEGLQLLRDVLATPAFEAGKLALRKEQLLAEMKQRNDDSGDIEERERSYLAFGDDHFSNRHVTQGSLQRLGQKDLQAFHARWVNPRNLVVAAAGDFDRAQLADKLDRLLSDWPAGGEAMTQAVPRPKGPPRPGLFLLDKPDVTQGRVSVLLPGITRDDPDYYAVQVMNLILGGGGFTSRITNRVRSDEGLAYHAGSRFPGGVYYPEVFLAQFQSKLRSCSYATSIVLEEIRKLREGGVTADELSTAKRQMVDALPGRFPTRAATVGLLAQEELTGRYARDPDFYRSYRARVEGVTADKVAAAARKWLDPAGLTILVVGKKQDLLNPDPAHPVAFPELLKAPLTELPMRDPLTLQPIQPVPGVVPAAGGGPAAGR